MFKQQICWLLHYCLLAGMALLTHILVVLAFARQTWILRLCAAPYGFRNRPLQQTPITLRFLHFFWPRFRVIVLILTYKNYLFVITVC